MVMQEQLAELQQQFMEARKTAATLGCSTLAELYDMKTLQLHHFPEEPVTLAHWRLLGALARTSRAKLKWLEVVADDDDTADDGVPLLTAACRSSSTWRSSR